MSFPPKPINRSNFFTQSSTIIAANNFHFHVLSFLFIFPFFFSIISLLTFLYITLSHSGHAVSTINPTSVSLSLLYTIFVFSLYVAGVATITHSTHQGLAGRPVNLSSAIKALSNSFLPLASTTLASIACLLSICMVFLIFIGLIYLTAIKIPCLDMNYDSYYFTGFCVVAFVIITLFLISCQFNLMLAGVIAVIERQWGFEPLRRSFRLIKGMKRASLIVLLIRGLSIWIVMLGLLTQILSSPANLGYLALLQSTYISLFGMIFMIQFVASNTVLYLYCKELHEESGIDIRREISKECVSLAVDDENVARASHVKAILCCAVLVVVGATMVFWLSFQDQAMYCQRDHSSNLCIYGRDRT